MIQSAGNGGTEYSTKALQSYWSFFASSKRGVTTLSILHWQIARYMRAHRRIYDPNKPFDYLAMQEREFRNPPPVPKGVIVTPIKIGCSGTEKISVPDKHPGKVILYIHGGAFVSGTAASRRPICAVLAKAGWDVVSVEYGLAPAHPFPEGLTDCFVAYLELLKQYGAGNVAIMGESAGATLTLAVAIKAKMDGIALPKCLVAVAPATILDHRLPSHIECVDSDAVVGAELFQEVQDIYLQASDSQLLRNPLVSPYYADWKNMPPVYLTACDNEVLRDDSVLLYEKLRAVSNNCHLELYHNKIHTFQGIPMLSEGRKAQQKIIAWMQQYF